MSKNLLEDMIKEPINLVATGLVVLFCIIILTQIGEMGNSQTREITNNGIDALQLLVTFGPPTGFIALILFLAYCWYESQRGSYGP